MSGVCGGGGGMSGVCGGGGGPRHTIDLTMMSSSVGAACVRLALLLQESLTGRHPPRGPLRVPLVILDTESRNTRTSTTILIQRLVTNLSIDFGTLSTDFGDKTRLGEAHESHHSGTMGL